MKLPILRSVSSGFTLVELMIAIAIVAVLATVGLTVFTGVQKNARDSRRIADIDALSKAMEAHNLTLGGICDGQTTNLDEPTYCPLRDTWFAAGKVPEDPLLRKRAYCIIAANNSTPVVDPAASIFTAAGGCDAAAGWTKVNQNTPVINNDVTQPYDVFKVCTLLEAQNRVYCKGSQQL